MRRCRPARPQQRDGYNRRAVSFLKYTRSGVGRRSGRTHDRNPAKKRRGKPGVIDRRVAKPGRQRFGQGADFAACRADGKNAHRIPIDARIILFSPALLPP
jgi:hypothetical protein